MSSGADPNSSTIGPKNNYGPSVYTNLVPDSTPPAHIANTAHCIDLSSRSKSCSSDLKIKRRKKARGCRSLPLITEVPPVHSNLSAQNGNDPLPSSNNSLDLNREPSNSATNQIRSDEHDETVSNEIRQTVAIGNEIGFQLEVDNHVLVEVVGSRGVSDGD